MNSSVPLSSSGSARRPTLDDRLGRTSHARRISGAQRWSSVSCAHRAATGLDEIIPLSRVYSIRQYVSTVNDGYHQRSISRGSAKIMSAHQRIVADTSRRRSSADTGSTSVRGSGPASAIPRSRTHHRTTAVLQWSEGTSSLEPLSRYHGSARDGSSRLISFRVKYEPSRCCAQLDWSPYTRACIDCSAATCPSSGSSSTTIAKSTSLCSSKSPSANDPCRYAPTKSRPRIERADVASSCRTWFSSRYGVGRSLTIAPPCG